MQELSALAAELQQYSVEDLIVAQEYWANQQTQPIEPKVEEEGKVDEEPGFLAADDSTIAVIENPVVSEPVIPVAAVPETEPA